MLLYICVQDRSRDSFRSDKERVHTHDTYKYLRQKTNNWKEDSQIKVLGIGLLDPPITFFFKEGIRCMLHVKRLLYYLFDISYSIPLRFYETPLFFFLVHPSTVSSGIPSLSLNFFYSLMGSLINPFLRGTYLVTFAVLQSHANHPSLRSHRPHLVFSFRHPWL